MGKKRRNPKLLKMKRRGRYKVGSLGMVNTGPTEGSAAASLMQRKQILSPTQASKLAEYEEISSAVARNVFSVLWQGDFRQGITQIHAQLVKDDGLKRFWLLIYADKYMWMKEHFPTRTRHFSIVYGTLQRAKDAMIVGNVNFQQQCQMEE